MIVAVFLLGFMAFVATVEAFYFASVAKTERERANRWREHAKEGTELNHRLLERWKVMNGAIFLAWGNERKKREVRPS